MTRSITFWVPGVPQPGGSKRAMKRGKKIVVFDDCKGNKGWREVVSYAARRMMGTIGAGPELPPLEGPLRLEVTFLMPRPKAHYHRTGQLRSDAPEFHLVKPDATKLLRSTEDAMTDARVWLDDAQVVQQIVTKRFSDRNESGAHVKVSQIVKGE